MRRSILGLAVLLLAGPHGAGAESLVLFFESGDCYNIFPGSTGVVSEFTIAATMDEMSGAEFALRGIPLQVPDGYILLEAIPNPAATVTGDPFGAGVRMTFSECQRQLVTLYSVRILRFGSRNVAAGDISFVQPDAPSHPEIAGPVLLRCDEPTPTAVGVGGVGERLLHPASNPIPADGATGVEVNLRLQWENQAAPSCWLSATEKVLYLGTSSDPPYDEPGAESGIQRHLLPNTTYYWRIIESGPFQRAVSPIWSFTTGDVKVSVEPTRWSRIKQLFQ